MNLGSGTPRSQNAVSAALVARDPLKTVARWVADAVKAGVTLPHAMALATVDSRGRPSVRNVLLKDVDARGVSFMTDARSRKVRELEASGDVAAVLAWPDLQRQVRIEGRVVPMDDDAAERHFRAMPRGHQLTVLTTRQSARLDRRATLLRRRRRVERALAGSEIEAPPHWVGYWIVPRRIELLVANEHLLNDRQVYVRRGTSGAWTPHRLEP